MKKLISFVFVLALTLAMGTTALAAEVASETTTPITRSERTTSNVQKRHKGRMENKGQKASGKEQTTSGKEKIKVDIKASGAVSAEQGDIINANCDSITAISKENSTFRTSIRSSLMAIKASGTTLDTEVDAKLKAYQSELKEIADNLKQTRGDIKEIIDANKDNATKLDTQAMETAFNSITSIQASTKVELTRANVILKAMVELLAK